MHSVATLRRGEEFPSSLQRGLKLPATSRSAQTGMRSFAFAQDDNPLDDGKGRGPKSEVRGPEAGSPEPEARSCIISRPPFTDSMKIPRFLVLFLLLTLAAFAQSPAIPAPPDTPQHAVTDEYQGVKVDRRLPLARELGRSRGEAVERRPERAHARISRSSARALPDPRQDQVAEQLEVGVLLRSAISRGHALRAQRCQPPQQQPLLVMLRSADDPGSAKVIFDPNSASCNGHDRHRLLRAFPRRKVSGAAMSEDGAEDAAAHVYDVATGKELSDVVPRVNGGTAGGSMAWNADGTGFYYTRYPQGNERPAEDANFYQQVYFTSWARPEARHVRPRQRLPAHRRDSTRTAAKTDDGCSHQSATATAASSRTTLDPPATGRRSPTSKTALCSAQFGRGAGASICFHAGRAARKDPAPAAGATSISAQAKVVVPQSQARYRRQRSRLDPELHSHLGTSLCRRHHRRAVALRVFESKAGERGSGGAPPVLEAKSPLPSAAQCRPSARWCRSTADDVLFCNVELSSIRRHGIASTPPRGRPHTRRSSKLLPWSSPSRGGARLCRIARRHRVPLNILRKKGTKLDGNNPVLLTGYGGYGVSTVAALHGVFGASGSIRAASMSIANLRGGAEYGEDWHKAGNLTHKQNVFDDFIACAQHLIDQKYTSPPAAGDHRRQQWRAADGRGLDAASRPYRAVVSYVGIYDMLRVELDPNGAFNVTEFGTVKDPEQFKALYAYSPYHHVKDGTAYPAVLLPTGANDHRVNPISRER